MGNLAFSGSAFYEGEFFCRYIGLGEAAFLGEIGLWGKRTFSWGGEGVGGDFPSGRTNRGGDFFLSFFRFWTSETLLIVR